jgi:acyl carrier protein
MTINQIIKSRLNLLKQSNRNFEAIFKIIHHNSDFLFSEKTDGYRIQKVTYGECYIYSYKMGLYLTSKLDDSKYVGLMMENSLEFITSMYGILMNNKIPVLLNVRLGNILNNQVIERLGITTVVADQDYKINANIINVKNFDYNQISNQINFNSFTWANEIALTTSATSLNIKICFYDGEAICTQIENSKDICNTIPLIKTHYNGYLKQLAFLPFYHIFGLMASYFWFSFFGRTFVFLKDLSSDTLLKTIKKHEVTHIFAVPMLWHIVYKNIIKEVEKEDEKTKNKFYKGLKLSTSIQKVFPKLGLKIAAKLFNRVRVKLFGDSVKFMISGGSYLSYDAAYTLNAIGYPLFNGYGMSEIGITSVELSSNITERIKRSIGKPLKTVNYKINENNQLLVKSRGICSKILTMNDEIITNYDEYFNTFDIVFIDKNNKYYIQGRTDDVVLTENGEKINPDVIEQTLNIPSAERYSLLGIKNGDNLELSLVLELKLPLSEIKINKINNDVENVINNLKKENYNINKIYYTFDPIAAVTAIKVSRKILSKWIEDGIVKLHLFSELKDLKIESLDELSIEVSNSIIKIFQDVLNINKNIDLNEHFIFDLGGTSLDYLTLLMKIEEKYDFKFHQNDEACYTVLQFTNYVVNLLK